MPANPKYLTKNPWQKFAKLSAGIAGGYFISALLHMVLALWIPPHKEILITAIYTLYIVWGGLLIVPFLFRNGWKCWLMYIIIMIFLGILYYFGNLSNPF